jgi:hypothetical protein
VALMLAEHGDETATFNKYYKELSSTNFAINYAIKIFVNNLTVNVTLKIISFDKVIY